MKIYTFRKAHSKSLGEIYGSGTSFFQTLQRRTALALSSPVPCNHQESSWQHRVQPWSISNLSVKMGKHMVLDENICRRRSPCNHHGSSWRPSRGDDVGNRFEDRCRVNVSDGFAAKGSFRQLVWPSSDKSYPCRHLHETILWSCAAKQVVATPWDPVLHPVEGRGHNHSWWGRSWHESNCTYDMKWDEMNTFNPLDTFLPYCESEPSSQPIFQQQSRSAFGEGLQKIYISGFHFNNIVTVSVIILECRLRNSVG